MPELPRAVNGITVKLVYSNWKCLRRVVHMERNSPKCLGGGRAMVATSRVKMAWARDRDGDIRHVDEVKTGKACECVCLDCGGVVYARNGGTRAHHFQHAADHNCTGEGVLHRVAKEFLAQIARVEGIVLPESRDSIDHEDWRGQQRSIEWEVPARLFLAKEAELESQRWKTVIPDVLLTDESGALLAIEIAVTHFKGEDEARFYRRKGIDAVEIDLSGISWRSTRQDLIDRLKGKLPFKWIFHGAAAAAAGRVRREAKEIDVLTRSDSVLKLPERISWLFDRYDLARLKAVVPAIEETASCIGRGGKTITQTYSADLNIREVVDDWAPVGSRWINRILVGNRSKPVNIFVQPDWVAEGSLSSECLEPTLVISVPDNVCQPVFAKWYGVDRWREKAQSIARKNLEEIIKVDGEKGRSQEGFLRRFSSADIAWRIKFLGRRLGHVFTYDLGHYHEEWNAHEAIWKALLWIYCIKSDQKRYVSINVDYLAGNDWVCGMLGMSGDDHAFESRKKLICEWMMRLEDNGIATLELDGRCHLRVDASNRVPGLSQMMRDYS